MAAEPTSMIVCWLDSVHLKHRYVAQSQRRKHEETAAKFLSTHKENDPIGRLCKNDSWVRLYTARVAEEFIVAASSAGYNPGVFELCFDQQTLAIEGKVLQASCGVLPNITFKQH